MKGPWKGERSSTNILTIDVEDYYHVLAFEDVVSRSGWERFERRVVKNTMRIIEILEAFKIKATFFVLGWVAEREPALIKEIARAGHEVASHGYDHRLVYRMGKEGFREDAKRSKAILEDITGKAVLGYRASNFSITEDSMWALEILAEEGFQYDSSIFPVKHPNYGIPEYERFPHIVQGDGWVIKEFPLSTLKVFNRNIPVAGGAYLRFMPVRFVKAAIEYINKKEKQPAIVYFHPWEIDPDQPRINAGWLRRIRHYTNIEKMKDKLSFLFERLSFSTVSHALEGITTNVRY